MRRRQRYTVTFEDGSRSVILAHTGASADSHYRERGRIPVKVERGDYRHAEASAAPGDRWHLDHGAIREACEYFGLDWPVDIKLTGRQGGRYGAHTIYPNRHGHFITVKRWLSAEQASRTLWHELTHAAQVERVAARAGATAPREVATAWRASPERGKGTSYLRKPSEVEAREHEALHDTLPLTKEVRG